MPRSRAAFAAMLSAAGWAAVLGLFVAGRSGVPVSILVMLLVGAAGGGSGAFLGWRARRLGPAGGSPAAAWAAIVSGLLLLAVGLGGLALLAYAVVFGLQR